MTDTARELIDDPKLHSIINAVDRPFKGDRDVLRSNPLACYGLYSIASGEYLWGAAFVVMVVWLLIFSIGKILLHL